MTTRILTIAAAAAFAVTAMSVTAPAQASPLSMASQSIVYSVDSPVIEISKKGGHKGGHRRAHRGGKWHGKHFGHKKFYHYKSYGHYAPSYYHGGCYKQVKALVGGYYVWHTVNVCY